MAVATRAMAGPEAYRTTTATDAPNPALGIMACSNVRAASSAAAAGVMSSEMTKLMPTACHTGNR